ncbi:MAG: GrpB family protein [Acidimicrobiales bacterium]
MTAEIVVTDYDPNWPSWFETIRRALWPVVDDLAIRIDHVGSTAVAGLAAKPIIDLDIVVGSLDEVAPVIERLASIGCRWRGDLGVEGREAFGPLPMEGLAEHHLYLVVENNRAHLDHWLLRDLLAEDPEALERYAALKRRNAELAGGDIDVYLAAKADLVAELLTRARALKGLPPETYWDPREEGS